MNHLKSLYQKNFQKEMGKLLRMISEEGPSSNNFASTDQLSLSKHPIVQTAAINFCISYGFGRSRPLSEEISQKIEGKLAMNLGKECVLLLEYSPKVIGQLLSVLTSTGSKLFQEIESSLPIPSDMFQFSNLETLANKLHNETSSTILYTSSINKTTREKAPLQELSSLKRSYNSILVVDDSETFSTYGRNGFGCASDFPEADIIVGHIPKTFGYYATYIATSKEFHDILLALFPPLNHKRLKSPLLLGSIDATTDLMPSMRHERRELRSNISRLHTHLSNLGYDVTTKDAAQLNLFFSHEEEIVQLHRKITEIGILTPKPKRNSLHDPYILSLIPNSDLSHSDISEFSSLFPSYQPPQSVETL